MFLLTSAALYSAVRYIHTGKKGKEKPFDLKLCNGSIIRELGVFRLKEHRFLMFGERMRPERHPRTRSCRQIGIPFSSHFLFAIRSFIYIYTYIYRYPSRFPPLEVLQTPRKDAHPRIVLRSPTFLSAANKDKCCFQCGYETANKISRPCTEGWYNFLYYGSLIFIHAANRGKNTYLKSLRSRVSLRLIYERLGMLERVTANRSVAIFNYWKYFFFFFSAFDIEI